MAEDGPFNHHKLSIGLPGHCNTRSPGSKVRTLRPTARTTPLTSLPRMAGSFSQNPFAARPIVFSNQWGSRWSPRPPRARSRRSALAREHCPHISGFQDHRIRTIELLFTSFSNSGLRFRYRAGARLAQSTERLQGRRSGEKFGADADRSSIASRPCPVSSRISRGFRIKGRGAGFAAAVRQWNRDRGDRDCHDAHVLRDSDLSCCR